VYQSAFVYHAHFLRGNGRSAARINRNGGAPLARPMKEAPNGIMHAKHLSDLGFSAVVSAPFGAVGIRVADGMLCELVYLPAGFKEVAPANRLAARVGRQITRYFNDPDSRFDLPLAPLGTTYQHRVWDVIGQIPRGQVRSYGAIARLLRSGPRAVGQACGANWFPMVIPCHRVVGAQGIGGFAGTDVRTAGDDPFHLEVKRWLLGHEGVIL